MHTLCTLHALCLVSLIGIAAGRLAEKNQKRVAGWKPEDLIPSSYNKLKPPSGVNGTNPCDIKISLNITQILGVNEADEVSITFFIQEVFHVLNHFPIVDCALLPFMLY